MIRFPSASHRGSMPPFVDTWIRFPLGGNGCTNTSPPPSSVAYSIHRPSGDHDADPSMKGVPRTSNGWPPPLIGSAQMSPLRSALSLRLKNSSLPSGEYAVGILSSADANSKLLHRGAA